MKTEKIYFINLIKEQILENFTKKQIDFEKLSKK